MKLWIRVALASTILILLVLTTVGGLLFFIEKSTLINAQINHQNESVQRLAQVCVESVAEQNDLILLNYILSLTHDPGVRFASFVDPQGKVVVHNDVSQVGQEGKDPVSSILISAKGLLRQEGINENNESILDIGIPVIYKENKIGVARIRYDQKYLAELIQTSLKETMMRFATVSGIAIIVGLLGSILFARTMTKPISVLAEATRVVGKGELTHRISLNRSDEIGQLAHSFNDMTIKLQELDQLKDDFVSSVSHELRSPLTALKGFLQMFQMGIGGKLSDQHQENVKLMLECTDRLGRFVNNILDVAKLEAGMFDIKLEPVDIKAVANEITVLFQPQAQQEKVHIYLDAPAQCPWIVGDSDRLKQVFTNLINNALKFTPENGQIKVWVREEPNVVWMGITDTGAGIPKEAIGKLFNKFEQVKETKSKSKGKGTGLGLTIVKKIVEGCGGTIQVQSELNKGTTFYFSLPKAQKPQMVAKSA